MHKRVAIFTFCSYDVINSPMINSAEYLAAQGYAVDIFARNPADFEAPAFRQQSICYRITAIKSGRIGARIGRVILFWNTWREMRKHSYDLVIGFDPPAFQHAWLLARLFRIPAVHHSLEFYPYDTFKQKIRRAIEALFLRRADWMITQDDMRADWLSQKFRFPRKKISVVYNTSFGDYLPQKSRHFRDKFKIPDEKKAVLAVGSLIQEHMILEIVQSVAQWPQEFALVIHGWFPDKVYEEKIRTVAERSPGCIFISTEFLPLDRKYEVFQSADIGLVAFTPDNDNNLFVGAAAGKLFEFLRCGVPAVVNELNGMRELIGGKCGEVCGSHLENIGYLLSKVDGQYAHYTDECRKFYANYGFAGCYKKFLTDFYQGEQGG